MFTTVEAEVDEQGEHPAASSRRPSRRVRVLVTVLEPEDAEAAQLSEAALATDWGRPEQDAAWSLASGLVVLVRQETPRSIAIKKG